MGILIYHDGAEKELRALAAENEKPENHIVDMKVAESAWDQERFIRRVQMIDPVHGVLNIRVVFSITAGSINDVPKRFRHVSISVNNLRVLPSPLVAIAVCQALGFTGTIRDWVIERHPDAPNVLAFFQEFKHGV